MRIQVRSSPSVEDGRASALLRRFRESGLAVRNCALSDVTILEGMPEVTSAFVREFFSDPVAQLCAIDDDVSPPFAWSLVVEVTYRAGVADPVVSSIRDALESEMGALPSDTLIQSARQVFLESDVASHALARELHNPLIQRATILTREKWERGERLPASYPSVTTQTVPPVQLIDVAGASDDELQALSGDRLLALTLPEMQAIRDHYAQPETIAARKAAGLSDHATDVELEMLAQTWSEHCKHKIFAARVEYAEGDSEPEIIDGLYETYIKATTRAVADPAFVKSVFHDNAGVVKFDDETLLCFKAETHNSPSALDPYGGAITGIVGVNRDILGTGKGARPIFNTNVLCFGYPDTDPATLPEGLLPPRVVLDGVHRGIVDGGNQSGIPVAAGAFLFDESFTGKPLVFCGTGGVLPAQIDGEDAWVKHVDPGDVAVMVGGLVGKDGIHGATFSSLALDETSPTSAVQIGEPITQRKVWDFLLEARDRGLYKGITDNGAGGISSSLGEMARDSGGVRIDLDGCPLKYDGLAAWEILVSESQERMSLAVHPDRLNDLLDLAEQRGVTANAVGEFTADGLVRITHRGSIVGLLPLDFLHDGLPQMTIPARWDPPSAPSTDGHDQAILRASASRRAIAAALSTAPAAPGDDQTRRSESAVLHEQLLALLRDPNIGSKEHLIRQYDHEVQGGSIVKPSCGPLADGPSDGAVLTPRYDSHRGITVTHGICPGRSDVDTYEMAVAAVDEAVRAHVALGGDPDQMAALDNFCWPDPVLSDATPDGPYKMAQLVRACRGLADACRGYRLPLISGKDSMKNDARLGGKKVSIRPTLLVSLTGIVPDVRQAMTTEFLMPGDHILLVGRAEDRGGEVEPDTTGDRMRLYRAMHQAIRDGLLHSVHDVSDGGMLVSIAESMIAGKRGASLTIEASHSGGAPDSGDTDGPAATLFRETIGTFVVCCGSDALPVLSERLGVSNIEQIGLVTEERTLRVGTTSWTLEELEAAWKSFSGDQAPGRFAPPAHLTQHADDAATARVRAVPGRPRVLILSGYGINAERELARAFEISGGSPRVVHVNDLLNDPAQIRRCSIFGVPGGFSYGDHLGSGLMLAHRLRAVLRDFSAFLETGGLAIGICNGFQVLVKLGVLPGLARGPDGSPVQEVSLVHNDSGRFENSWVRVRFADDTGSPWLDGLGDLDVPIRHGEGRLVLASSETGDRLEREHHIALRYLGRNPNGSWNDVAGLVDRTGRVLGMMPHPEAFLTPQNHPHWRSGRVANTGLRLFENAVQASNRV